MINKFYSAKDKKRLFKRHVKSVLFNDIRTPFQKDRDRVLHSEPFRRLQNKTQVLLPGENDFYRTRLTHSIEVAQIGRTISYFLNQQSDLLKNKGFQIDYDLVEAICMSHDIGHPPFGHLGEYALNTIMDGPKANRTNIDHNQYHFLDDVKEELQEYNDFGFEGNAQNLRIIENLGNLLDDSKGQDGFNPTYAMWQGMLKYLYTASYAKDNSLRAKYIYDSTYRSYSDEQKTFFNQATEEYEMYNFRSIENQIMEMADDISYSVLDLEDAYDANFINPVNLLKVIEFIEHYQLKYVGNYEIPGKTSLINYFKKSFSSKAGVRSFKNFFISLFVADLKLIEVKSKIKNSRFKYKLVFENEHYYLFVNLFKLITKEFVYTTPHLLQLRHSFPSYIVKMFKAFYYDTKLLPMHVQASLPENISIERRKKINKFKLEVWSKPRIICDYISSMTDHHFLKKYKKMFQGGEIAHSLFE